MNVAASLLDSVDPSQQMSHSRQQLSGLCVLSVSTNSTTSIPFVLLGLAEVLTSQISLVLRYLPGLDAGEYLSHFYTDRGV